MEMNKLEVAVVEHAVKEMLESQINELNNLQLALVGGGIGTVVIG